jgi:hypothetical protein
MEHHVCPDCHGSLISWHLCPVCRGEPPHTGAGCRTCHNEGFVRGVCETCRGSGKIDSVRRDSHEAAIVSTSF